MIAHNNVIFTYYFEILAEKKKNGTILRNISPFFLTIFGKVRPREVKVENVL